MSKAENRDLKAEQTAHFAFARGFMKSSDKLQEIGETRRAIEAEARSLSHFDALRQLNWGGVLPDISEVLNGSFDIRIELLENSPSNSSET